MLEFVILGTVDQAQEELVNRGIKAQITSTEFFKGRWKTKWRAEDCAEIQAWDNEPLVKGDDGCFLPGSMYLTEG